MTSSVMSIDSCKAGAWESYACHRWNWYSNPGIPNPEPCSRWVDWTNTKAAILCRLAYLSGGGASALLPSGWARAGCSAGNEQLSEANGKDTDAMSTGGEEDTSVTAASRLPAFGQGSSCHARAEKALLSAKSVIPHTSVVLVPLLSTLDFQAFSERGREEEEKKKKANSVNPSTFLCLCQIWHLSK